MTVNTVKLSQLLGLRVEDEDGRSLGHVHDVRVRRTTTGEPARAPSYHVDSLIIGTPGLRARLGWGRAREPEEVAPDVLLAWDDVLAIASERILVRGKGKDSRRP